MAMTTPIDKTTSSIPRGDKPQAATAASENNSNVEESDATPRPFGLASSQDSVPEVDVSELKNAVTEMSRLAQNKQRALEFTIDEDSGETIIRVIDKETRQVIRQIPPDEALTMSERMGANVAGSLIKARV